VSVAIQKAFVKRSFHRTAEKKKKKGFKTLHGKEKRGLYRYCRRGGGGKGSLLAVAEGKKRTVRAGGRGKGGGGGGVWGKSHSNCREKEKRGRKDMKSVGKERTGGDTRGGGVEPRARKKCRSKPGKPVRQVDGGGVLSQRPPTPNKNKKGGVSPVNREPERGAIWEEGAG